MILPPRKRFPALQPGVFMLSVEFDHAPTVLFETRYDNEYIARSEAKEIALRPSVASVALIGRKADGTVGVLDCFSFGIWDSDAFDLAAYEEACNPQADGPMTFKLPRE